MKEFTEMLSLMMGVWAMAVAFRHANEDGDVGFLFSLVSGGALALFVVLLNWKA